MQTCIAAYAGDMTHEPLQPSSLGPAFFQQILFSEIHKYGHAPRFKMYCFLFSKYQVLFLRTHCKDKAPTTQESGVISDNSVTVLLSYSYSTNQKKFLYSIELRNCIGMATSSVDVHQLEKLRPLGKLEEPSEGKVECNK